MDTTKPIPAASPSTALVLYRGGGALPQNPPPLTGGLISKLDNKNNTLPSLSESLAGNQEGQGGLSSDSPYGSTTYVDFYHPENALGEFRDLFHYDWLQGSCTIKDCEDVVFNWIQSDLGLLPQLDNKGGSNGFGVRQNFVESYGKKSDDFAIQALCEHKERVDDIHLVVTGGRPKLCDDLMGFIVKYSGGVSRVDVAADFLADFENVVNVAWNALPRIMRRKLPHFIQGEDGGRTVYLGSRQSDFFLRIYEKGIQLVALGQNADPRWIRMEFQWRPSSCLKHPVAGRPARDIAVSTRWSSMVVSKVAAYLGANGGIHRVKIIPEERTKTVVETVVFSVDQYRRHVQQAGLDLISAGDKELEALLQEVRRYDAYGMLDEAEVAFVKFNSLVYEKMNIIWVEGSRVDWVYPCTGEFGSYNPRVSEFLKRSKDHEERRNPKATVARAKRTADRQKQDKADAERRRLAYTARRDAFFKPPVLTAG